jgi:hypothetical protein
MFVYLLWTVLKVHGDTNRAGITVKKNPNLYCERISFILFHRINFKAVIKFVTFSTVHLIFRYVGYTCIIMLLLQKYMTYLP